MMEQRARETLTPAPEQEPKEFPWSNPTAAWYTPPEEKPAEGISTETLRDQMAEREVMRHALLPEGEKDDGTGRFSARSFITQRRLAHSQDDALKAATASVTWACPFGMTLENLEKASEMLEEYTPDKVKDLPWLPAAGAVWTAIRLHSGGIDLATANAVSNAFETMSDPESRMKAWQAPGRRGNHASAAGDQSGTAGSGRLRFSDAWGG